MIFVSVEVPAGTDLLKLEEPLNQVLNEALLAAMKLTKEIRTINLEVAVIHYDIRTVGPEDGRIDFMVYSYGFRLSQDFYSELSSQLSHLSQVYLRKVVKFHQLKVDIKEGMRLNALVTLPLTQEELVKDLEDEGGSHPLSLVGAECLVGSSSLFEDGLNEDGSVPDDNRCSR